MKYGLKKEITYINNMSYLTIHIRERGLSRIEANAFVCVRSFVCVCLYHLCCEDTCLYAHTVRTDLRLGGKSPHKVNHSI